MKLNEHTSENRLGLGLRLGLGGERCGRRGEDSVALVITLLMLSVITFLAVTFLAMSNRNRSAVSASLDAATARAMGDAAQARAQAEIMAQILAAGDPLKYDYMVSRDYISPAGFNGNENNVYDSSNVNYDWFSNSPVQINYNNPVTPMTNYGTSAQSWVQNIANLWYDPRPPVFVLTNPAANSTNGYDFRFWVDINRNGRFETNGYQPIIVDEFGHTNGYNMSLNGEPEFIGVLKNPLQPHSSSNQFIGRYAYMVLPIGKTLDFNYIHNWLKGTYANIVNLNGGNYPINNNLSNSTLSSDGFARDQGIGSWELNLAGLLDAVSPWAYENTSFTGSLPFPLAYNTYSYFPPVYPGQNNANTGNAFEDAESILHYRYMPPYYQTMNTLIQDFPIGPVYPTNNYLVFLNNYIDTYCANAPTVAPFDYADTLQIANVPTNYPVQKFAMPWPGSYQTNMFYDVQDLFDTNKTSTNFIMRMLYASQRNNTFDRYTFMRLLSSISMGSSPEYGVWVHDDFGHQTLRTKVNINYDNTAQINSPNAPYAPMPTNLVSWTPLGFFTNAAELLLRSQTFMFTNLAYSGPNLVVLPNPISVWCGVTNIPIYRASQPGVRYNTSIHRMLQLAANIYDATVSSNFPSSFVSVPPVRHPSVFRPQFQVLNAGTTNVGINIVRYVQVTNDAYAQMYLKPFQELTNVLVNPANFDTNGNVWGIPWVVGANKGLPQFNQYSYDNRILFTRKLQYVRLGTTNLPNTNKPPHYTNQFYCMAVSNIFGMNVWNPYPSNFNGSSAGGNTTTCYISNLITVQLTNEYHFQYTTNITNIYLASTTNQLAWQPNEFKIFCSNAFITVPPCYFSETNNWLVFFTNIDWSNQFQSVDSQQSGWPVHNWTLNVTNHIVYALFDGLPSTPTSPSGVALLDFVNLGPFGSTVSITNQMQNNGSGNGTVQTGAGTGLDYWAIGSATDAAGSAMSAGMLSQIWDPSYNSLTAYKNSLIGTNPPCLNGLMFGAPIDPSNVLEQIVVKTANDPMVHYTIDDLNWISEPAPWNSPALNWVQSGNPIIYPGGESISSNTTRYAPWNAADTIGNNMTFKDPLVSGATNWDFPTNKFPGVGWIGRVHRGTPWQTVFLKADVSYGASNRVYATTVGSPWYPYFQPYEMCPETYPTNDWALLDLFTAAPNDNAARGLLSVNQTNDAAWAAVFAGVIAPTNAYGGVQIMPNNYNGIYYNFTNLVDGPNGINAWRANPTNNPNGIFHHVGDILSAPALTIGSSFLITNGFTGVAAAQLCSDEVVERIPQQVLGLLKVGEPQFVIFGWGQSLKPKGPPYLGGGVNQNIYTNYEITGETLTRAVCHIVHTNGMKLVIDSYNVETGNP